MVASGKFETLGGDEDDEDMTDEGKFKWRIFIIQHLFSGYQL